MIDVELSAEALVAVAGVLRKKNDPLTEVTAEAARRLPAAWAEKVGAFFDETEFRRFTLPKLPDYEDTYEQLVAGLHPEDAATMLQFVTAADLAAAVRSLIERARAYLRDHWPMNSIDTVAGPIVLPPSTMEQADAATLFSVINAPGRILDEMLMGTLIDEQAVAVRDLYPGLFGRLKGLVEAEIRERRAVNDKYEVPWDRERVLRRLAGLPQDAPVARLKLDVTPPPAASPPAANIDIDFSNERPAVMDRAT